jgi:hypothetical protein
MHRWSRCIFSFSFSFSVKSALAILALRDGLLTYAALTVIGVGCLASAFAVCFSRNSSRRAIIGLVLCGLACIALGVASLSPISRSSVRVIKCAPEFHLLTARVLRGHDRIYAGNQIEGRAREFLWRKAHLKIQLIPVISAGAVRAFNSVGPPAPVAERCVLAIRVRSGERDGPHPGLEAILQDKAGRSLPLHGGNLTAFSKDRKEYVASWDLNVARTAGGTYQAKIKRGDTCLAELELKDLPPVTHQPFQTGPNGF